MTAPERIEIYIVGYEQNAQYDPYWHMPSGDDCAIEYIRADLAAIVTQPDPRPLSEAEAFALSAPTSAPHASMADMQEWMQEWAESIQQPDPRDEVIAGLVEALERIGGVRGPYGFPFPEANIDYGAFAVMEAREALAAAKAVIK